MWFAAALMVNLLSSITTVRSIYLDAIDNSSKADELVSVTKSHNQNALYRAYYGTGLALQAKHSWNPATKLSKASLASSELNAAVGLDANNMEIRFLRFSFEGESPDFLGYSTHIKEDKDWLLSHLLKSHPLWDVMKKYLSQSKFVSAEERKLL